MNKCSELSNIKNKFLRRIKEISCDRISYNKTMNAKGIRSDQLPIVDHMIFIFIVILLIILYLIN